MSAPVAGLDRNKVTGWLLFLTIIASIIVSLSGTLPRYLPGILIWCAAILFLPGLTSAQKKQVYGMSAIGAAGLLYGLFAGIPATYILKALEANQMVIAMISAVSLLKVINSRDPHAAVDDVPEKLPHGRHALLRTIFGLHLVGSAINISALFLISDRLSAHRPLTMLQALTVSRAFSTLPFWSPFFASMGISLMSAPGSDLGTLILYSLPVTLTALAITVVEVMRHPDAPTTYGYPMHLQAVWLPAVLAVLVITAHYLWPDISVLTLITVICLLFTIGWLALRRPRQATRILHAQITDQLPRFSGEVAIIFAASLLAAGITAFLQSIDLTLNIQQFGGFEATLLVIAMLLLSMTGMHPVGSVSLAASLLAPVVDNPNLLGSAFLMGWGLCIGLSPFSGLQISLASRYHIDRMALMKMNWLYMLLMLVVCSGLLHLYARA